jgi:hypothetical protein
MRMHAVPHSVPPSSEVVGQDVKPVKAVQNMVIRFVVNIFSMH